MVQTRVGYAGGREEQPTYRSIGTHAEAVRIVFDPSDTSYVDLLELLPTSRRPRLTSGQYRSLVLPSDEAHMALARDHLQKRGDRGTELIGPGTPEARFWDAEDYHQKYYLRRREDLVRALEAELGPNWDRFPVATKLNSGNTQAMRAWLEPLSENTRRLALGA